MISVSGLTLLIKELLIGFCLGTANIIPGVSGGTFLLIFKIYERVFSILGNINKTNIAYLCRFPFQRIKRSDKNVQLNSLGQFFRENDFYFLLKLLIGAGVAIVSLSSLMKYLIVNHFSYTYSLFFGLILVSIVIPVRMLKEKQASLLFFMVLGAALTVYVTWAVNPYQKVEKKSAMYAAAYVENQQADKTAQKTDADISFTSQYTLNDYLYAFLCGAVAVSAMVLPGISGSLVLILMGEYFAVVSAISGLATLSIGHFIFLASFSLGIVLGGLFFARLISVVLKRYYNATMAFLIGLMAGSLYALWPFKHSIVMAHRYVKTDGQIQILENVRVYTNINVLPQFNTQLYISILFLIIGGVLMLFFVKTEQEN